MKRKRDNDEANDNTSETRKGKEKVRVEEADEPPLEEELEDIPVYEGETHPETGLPHGRGALVYKVLGDRFEGSFKNGEKEGEGVFYFTDGATLRGTYVDGQMHCLDSVYTHPDGSTQVADYVDGDICGHVEERDKDGNILFKGEFWYDLRHGPGICYYPDGGSLEGGWKGGMITSDHAIYTYPDGVSQLVGKWEENEMVAAVFRKKGDERGPQEGEPLYEYDPSTEDSISSHPLLSDPYESERVRVGPSTVEDGGEGLFARRKMMKGEVVAFYNGILVSHEEVDAREWALNANTISLDDDWVIDVPPDASDLESYRASLGHKANCQITQDLNNSKYDLFTHPRFGVIKCIRLVRDVEEGEEIFVDYDYTTECPEWYGAPRSAEKKGEEKGAGEEEKGEGEKEGDTNPQPVLAKSGENNI